ncbi:MAG: AraC family transcriptional regulator, partial [Sphaerochaetaceae bacterium]|nr:AraC family transcriptional regulator [Sphaerochaetaceae bacterium]
MNCELLKKLGEITPEEREILAGHKDINRNLYYSAEGSSEIDSSKVLENGKQIDIRPHTRFVHFPKHTHNYIEMIYMVQGSTIHLIDNEKIILNEGDLLLLNQNATQEILPAGEADIAVNFMILPSFFDETFKVIYSEENLLKDFIVSCLTRNGSKSNYLYFNAGGIVPVQNLMENLIWNLIAEEPKKRSVDQLTMSLLFLSLVNHSDRIHVAQKSFEQKLTLEVLRYIDQFYPNATLQDMADRSKMDVYTLSRIIKRQTGEPFKTLLEKKRLSQACFLLSNTDLTIEDISLNVGYENLSFFYRLFQRTYGRTPREYR